MLSPDVFTSLRISPERDQYILILTNVTNKLCHLNIPPYKLGACERNWYDLVSSMEWMAENQGLFITMQPYDVIWLEPLQSLRQDCVSTGLPAKNRVIFYAMANYE